jgi:hypothetical protein
MRDYLGQYGRAGWATDDNTAHAYCMLVNKDTNNNSALQWLRERAAVLLYTYIACIVTSLSLIKAAYQWWYACHNSRHYDVQKIRAVCCKNHTKPKTQHLGKMKEVL